MRRVTLFLMALAAISVEPARAESWVDLVFPERSHDFGTVARGSKCRYTFKLINRTNSDIHIAEYRTKCGCTEVHIGARDIPPGTQTTVEAVMDTTQFHDYKPSGLTIVIDRPQFIEVELKLSAWIRTDLTLSPGQVDFGTVQRTSGRTVPLTLNYAGGIPNWGITKAEQRSKDFSAKITETSRTADGRVSYAINATLLPSVKAGPFKDVITLHTNDAANPTIPIAVSGNIQTLVAVSPSILPLGPVKPGQKISKKVFVRSAEGQSFKVTNLKPSENELAATAGDQESKSIHAVNLTYTAPTEAGPNHAFLEIETDIKDEPPAKLTVFANVTP